MNKRTLQRNVNKRQKKIGFRSRMSTKSGRKILSRQRRKKNNI